MVEKMLDLPNIRVFLNTSVKPSELNGYDHVFYSGTIDSWYDYKFGDLAYRTLDFEMFHHKGDFQGTSVMNYCEADVPFTRITEFKHFTPWESHENSTCYKEFSRQAKRDDIPYYPIRLAQDKTQLELYIQEARKDRRPVTFAGRLGTYRYLDMHVCIAESLKLARQFMNASNPSEIKFSAEPL